MDSTLQIRCKVTNSFSYMQIFFGLSAFFLRMCNIFCIFAPEIVMWELCLTKIAIKFCTIY